MQTVEATVSALTPGTFSCCLSGLLTNVDPFPSQIYGSILSPTFSPTLRNRQLLIEIELRGTELIFLHSFPTTKLLKAGDIACLLAKYLPNQRMTRAESDHRMCGMKGGGRGVPSRTSSSPQLWWETAQGKPKTGREERQRGRVVVIRTSVMQPYASARLVVHFGQLSSDDSLLGLVETKAKCTFGLRLLCFLHGFTQI